MNKVEKEVVLAAKGLTEMSEKLKAYQNKGYRLPNGGVRYRGTIIGLRTKTAVNSLVFEDGSNRVGRGVSGTIAHIINGDSPLKELRLSPVYKRKLDSVSMEVTLVWDETIEILAPKEEPKKVTKKKPSTKKKPTKKEK